MLEREKNISVVLLEWLPEELVL